MSETSEVATHSYMHTSNVRVMLVDTPGFEDSREGVSDVDILQQIVEFLGSRGSATPCHRNDDISDSRLRKLSGLLYLHRISDPRVGKVARRNLRMFKKLCGDKALKHSVIVTTFWGSVSERDGLRRERELCADETLFKALLENGARVMRHNFKTRSAMDIMEHVVGMPPVVLQVQTELSSGLALKDTAAGQDMSEHIRELQQKYQRELKDLRSELEKAAKDGNRALMAELTTERSRLEKMMKKNQRERDKLERDARNMENKLTKARAKFHTLSG
jgi:hypothetical protein